MLDILIATIYGIYEPPFQVLLQKKASQHALQ